jgi:hypothetical protein
MPRVCCSAAASSRPAAGRLFAWGETREERSTPIYEPAREAVVKQRRAASRIPGRAQSSLFLIDAPDALFFRPPIHEKKGEYCTGTRLFRGH